MISQVQRQLLEVLSAQLYGKTGKTPETADWSALMREALQQSVFLQVFRPLEPILRSALPKEEFLELQRVKMQLWASNLRNAYLHGALHSLLTDHGISYTVLKGMASAAYYEEPLLRTMGDVDFLVSLSDREQAEQLLLAEGFQKEPHAEDHGFHWAYQRGQDVLELHWQVPGLPENGGEKVTEQFSDLLSASEETDISGFCCRVPSPRHHGLILLLHTAEHLTSGGAGIRHLCDWLSFVCSMPESRFTALLEQPLRELGLWRFACALTKAGVLFLGCEPRAFCAEIDDELAEALLEDFLDGGTFGNKNSLRQGQTKIVRDNATREAGQASILRSALGNLDRRARQDHPVCERHALLRPLFWLWTALQYLLRVACGKRVNIFGRKSLHKAQERRSLYASLELFRHADPKPSDSEIPEQRR